MNIDFHNAPQAFSASVQSTDFCRTVRNKTQIICNVLSDYSRYSARLHLTVVKKPRAYHKRDLIQTSGELRERTLGKGHKRRSRISLHLAIDKKELVNA